VCFDECSAEDASLKDCNVTESVVNHNIEQRAQQIANQLRQVNDRNVVELILANYIEEITHFMLGIDNVCSFFTKCFHI
jgi:dihydroxyacetone kinase